MAPFRQAVNVKSALQEENVKGDFKTYTGIVDPDWVVGAWVIHPSKSSRNRVSDDSQVLRSVYRMAVSAACDLHNRCYILALLVEACLQHQYRTRHPDPIHVTAHYLRSSQPSEFEIRVRTLRTGRGFTNLTAELYQQGTVTVSTQQIFGVNSVLPDGSTESRGLTLAPPSSYARRIPLHTHPSTAVPEFSRDVWKFKPYVTLSPDPKIFEKNAPSHPNRTNASTIGGTGLEWGAWFSFRDEGDKITTNSLAFLVDVFAGLPYLMPRSERQGLGI
ncbi:hypothetical protein C0993_000586, partial [Termitomyces sp. T159_Od127]